MLYDRRYRRSQRCGSWGTWSSRLVNQSRAGTQGSCPLCFSLHFQQIVIVTWLFFCCCCLFKEAACTVTGTWKSQKDPHAAGLVKGRVSPRETSERHVTGHENSMNLRPMIQTGQLPCLIIHPKLFAWYESCNYYISYLFHLTLSDGVIAGLRSFIPRSFNNQTGKSHFW